MNKTSEYKLTVIVPVYNEEDNIYPVEAKMSEFLAKTGDFPTCVLFVNDGSKDDSFRRIKEVCDRRKDFYYISLEKNSGLTAAMKAGFDSSFSDYAGYIDADLQTDPEDFLLLIPYVKDYELVMGIRTNRKDSFVKNMSSKIANGFRRFMTKDGVEDTGCPLKIIRTEYAKRIPMFKGMHRFLPALIQLQYGTVKQIPVRHFPRVAGKSKYNLSNRLVAPFIDCFGYRWMKKRYTNYKVGQNNI